MQGLRSTSALFWVPEKGGVRQQFNFVQPSGAINARVVYSSFECLFFCLTLRAGFVRGKCPNRRGEVVLSDSTMKSKRRAVAKPWAFFLMTALWGYRGDGVPGTLREEPDTAPPPPPQPKHLE